MFRLVDDAFDPRKHSGKILTHASDIIWIWYRIPVEDHHIPFMYVEKRVTIKLMIQTLSFKLRSGIEHGSMSQKVPPTDTTMISSMSVPVT